MYYFEYIEPRKKIVGLIDKILLLYNWKKVVTYQVINNP